MVDCFRSFRCRGDWNRPGDRSKRGEARPRGRRCNRAGGDLSHRGISGSTALMHWGLAREKAGFPVDTGTKTIARSAVGGDLFCGEPFVPRSRPFARRFGTGTADRVQHLSGNRSRGGRLHLPHPETTLRSRSGSGGRSLGGAQLAPLAGNSRLVARGRSPAHDALAVVDASLGEARYASRTPQQASSNQFPHFAKRSVYNGLTGKCLFFNFSGTRLVFSALDLLASPPLTTRRLRDSSSRGTCRRWRGRGECALPASRQTRPPAGSRSRAATLPRRPSRRLHSRK